MSGFLNGLQIAQRGCASAWASPVVNKCQRQRVFLLLVLAAGTIVGVAGLLSSLHIMLWFASFLVDVQKAHALLEPMRVLTTTALLTSVGSLVLLKGVFDPGQVFFDVLRSGSPHVADSLEVMPPDTAWQRLKEGLIRTLQQVSLAILVQLAIALPSLSCLLLPSLLYFELAKIMQRLEVDFRLKQQHYFAISAATGLLVFCVPMMRTLGMSALLFFRLGSKLARSMPGTRRWGLLYAAIATLACAIIPTSQGALVACATAILGCSITTSELLFPLTTRLPKAVAEKLIYSKATGALMLGFGAPFTAALMMPGLGALVWTYSTGAAGELALHLLEANPDALRMIQKSHMPCEEAAETSAGTTQSECIARSPIRAATIAD